MAKPYSVKPFKLPGWKTYTATFRISTGKRVSRSLKETNPVLANHICAGLVLLWKLQPTQPEDVPTGQGISEKAKALYFDTDLDMVVELESTATNKANIEGKTEVVKTLVSSVLKKSLEESERNKHLALALAQTREELARVQAEKDALASSIVGKAIESASKAPPLAEALTAYAAYLKTFSEKHATDMFQRAQAFAATQPAGGRVSAVPPSEIAKFINAEAAKGDRRYVATRYTYWRSRLGAFFNWSAKTWEYASQMSAVPVRDQQLVDRERGEIHWHELAEVQQVITGLAAPYWKALVGTLAYAGLQLSELIWLRRSDLRTDANGLALWITTVEDGDTAHPLKRANRQRLVRVHAKYLAPLLQAHVQALPAGDWLFPMPADVRQRKRAKTAGSVTRWRMDTLSTMLRGNKGGKSRSATPGILPAGMNALSLRRTFGSLLLRSGKTPSDVAAAMGNTPEVVRRHYARILGCEVSVEF